MAKGKKDLRFRRNDYAIKQAFWKLVERRGLQATSVQAVIARSGINRVTFHRHYATKADLLATVEADLLATLKQQASKLPLAELKAGHASEALPAYYQSLTMTIAAQREKLTALLGDEGDPAFIQKFIQMDTRRLKSLALDKQSAIPVNYLLAGLTGMVITLIGEWARRGFQESTEEFTQILERLLTPIVVSDVFHEANPAGTDQANKS